MVSTEMSPSPTRKMGRPRKTPVDEQRQILLAAGRKVFARHGLRSATIEEIARQAGESRAAVYQQFGDKNTLFDVVVEAAAAETNAAFRERVGVHPEIDDRAWLRFVFAECYAWCVESRETIALLGEAMRARNPCLTRFWSRMHADFAARLRARAGRQGQDISPSTDALVRLIFGMSDALVRMAWHERSPEEVDVVLDLLSESTAARLAALLNGEQDAI